MKKTNSISIRLSEEEEKILNHKCKERGVDRSTYIREAIFSENNRSNIYNQKVRVALDIISGTCIEIRENSLEHLQSVERLEEGVKLLWQSLR
jgi:hypothetical protein